MLEAISKSLSIILMRSLQRRNMIWIICSFTQGWSSYDWKKIFNTKPVQLYPYEQGISFKATINKKRGNSYIIQPMTLTKSFIFNVEDPRSKF